MFKRVLLAASAMLLSIGMMAQTVDFTGITVNTERVTKKKVYERKSFVLADGVFMGGAVGPTALFGVRYGMVWRLGFYVGAELGIDGFPVSRDYLYGDEYDHAEDYETRVPAFTLNAGLVIRLSRVANLYLGPGLTLTHKECKLDDGWYINDPHLPGIAGELGVYLHFGRVSMMAGAYSGPIIEGDGFGGVKLGVGFNF